MSKYNVDIRINKYKNAIQNDKTFDNLMKAVEDILGVLYSSIISLRMYFFNQFKLLKSTLMELEEEILQTVRSTGKQLTKDQSLELNNLLKSKLEKWLSIRYRIDNTVMYLHKGENLDENLLLKLFKTESTLIKERPKLSELDDYHAEFSEKPWNLCSYYGIKANFRLLKNGYNILKKLSDQGKLTSYQNLINRFKILVNNLIIIIFN